MPTFLIEYNRRSGEADVEQYENPVDAMRARFARMRARSSSDIEVVTITAKDIDEVKRTHSRYFRSEDMAVPV